MAVCGISLSHYDFDATRSCVWISGRSSLHPINTETRGISGWFEVACLSDGSLDLTQPVQGSLFLAVERLSSGNQLYDRELRRRIDAERYPTISGRLTRVLPKGDHPDYLVRGDVEFHGRTLSFEHEMQIEVHDDELRLSGEDVFDVREFGMKPPSMLMVRVYPEIRVRIDLLGIREAPHSPSTNQ